MFCSSAFSLSNKNMEKKKSTTKNIMALMENLIRCCFLIIDSKDIQ